MKQQQQKSEAASGQNKKKKVTAAQLRVQKGELRSSRAQASFRISCLLLPSPIDHSQKQKQGPYE
jgi:hypothetical protein